MQGVAWTSGSVRATGLATQDGVYVKSGSPNYLYLGSIYINSSGSNTSDSGATRYVWNNYNRISKPLFADDTTSSWTYTTNTFRPFNNSMVNGVGRVSFLVGLQEDAIFAVVNGACSNSSVALAVGVGIGYDSTSTRSSKGIGFATSIATVDEIVNTTAQINTIPSVGHHYLSTLEYSQSKGTTTWRGSNYNTGLTGSIFV